MGPARTPLEDVSNLPIAGSTVSLLSSKTGSVEDLAGADRVDIDNPQCAVEYVADIYAHYRKEESKFQPKMDYMKEQTDINEKMRMILIVWLVEVHQKYKLKPETLFLAVNIVDRFLERRQVSRKKLQLVGVTSLLIAAKYEEIYAPEIRDFVYITDRAFSKQEILDMEIIMLNTLKFHITVPTALHFLDRLHRVTLCDEVNKCLGHYLLELALVETRMHQYAPSHLAAATMFLTNKLLHVHPSWPATLIKQTRYTEGIIKNCAKDMCGLLEDANRSAVAPLRKKYASEKYRGVANMTW